MKAASPGRCTTPQDINKLRLLRSEMVGQWNGLPAFCSPGAPRLSRADPGPVLVRPGEIRGRIPRYHDGGRSLALVEPHLTGRCHSSWRSPSSGGLSGSGNTTNARSTKEKPVSCSCSEVRHDLRIFTESQGRRCREWLGRRANGLSSGCCDATRPVSQANLASDFLFGLAPGQNNKKET